MTVQHERTVRLPDGTRLRVTDLFDVREVFEPTDLAYTNSFALPDVGAIVVLRVKGLEREHGSQRIRLYQDGRCVLDIPRALDDQALSAPITIKPESPLHVREDSCAVALYGLARRPSL